MTAVIWALRLLGLLLFILSVALLWVYISNLRAFQRIEQYLLKQGAWVAERQAIEYCVANGLVICTRCRRRPVAANGVQCEFCGI